MLFRLAFDGGCFPNPGGLVCYGWVLKLEPSVDTLADDLLLAEGRGVIPPQDLKDAGIKASNNTAEYYAVLQGMIYLNELRKDIRHLVLQGDSQLILNQLSGRKGINYPHLAALNDAVRDQLKILHPKQVEYRWVRREENKRADELANLARREYKNRA